MATKEQASAVKERILMAFGDKDYTTGFGLSKDVEDPESWVVAVGLKHSIPGGTIPRSLSGVKIVTTVTGIAKSL